MQSGQVEVVFDEEFIGGVSLQGTCDPFRGRLVPWANLLPLAIEESAAATCARGVRGVGGAAPVGSARGDGAGEG